MVYKEKPISYIKRKSSKTTKQLCYWKDGQSVIRDLGRGHLTLPWSGGKEFCLSKGRMVAEVTCKGWVEVPQADQGGEDSLRRKYWFAKTWTQERTSHISPACSAFYNFLSNTQVLPYLMLIMTYWSWFWNYLHFLIKYVEAKRDLVIA